MPIMHQGRTIDIISALLCMQLLHWCILETVLKIDGELLITNRIIMQVIIYRET